MLYKSDELKRLYGHIRHPSFTSLFVILFATNIMRFAFLEKSIYLFRYNFFFIPI